MTYQIPSKGKHQFLLQETKVSLYRIKPSRAVKLQHVVVTMFLKGHLATDFKMRLNLYKDGVGRNLLLSSTPVNNLEITRVGDYYCEIRFDFPAANNRMAIDVDHLLEFEVYDGYTYDVTNNLSLVLDAQASMAYLGSDVIHLDAAASLGHRISVFLAQIERQTDEKFFLVRVDGAKLFNGIVDYVTYGGGFYLYSCTIQKNLFIDTLASEHFQISDATSEQNISRVYTPIVPNPLDWTENLNKYYYDPATGEIMFYSDLLLDNGYGAIMKYALFFTNFRGRYADPYLSGFPIVVYWEPRLQDGQTFDFSQENNFNGLLSIAASSITLKNQDRYMNGFFGPNDCFNNRQVNVWRCEGDVSQFTHEFTGTIRAASLNDDSCSIEVQDNLATMDKSYEDERVTYFDQLGYATEDILEEDRRKVIPRLFGKRGPYELAYYDSTQAVSAGHTFKIKGLNGEKMTQAVNVSRNDVFATNVNRTWSLGFGPPNATDIVVDCTLHTQLVLGAFEASILTLDTFAGMTVNNIFAPGDTFKNGTQYGIVYDVSDTEIYVWPYNAAYSASNNVERKKIPAVVIKSGDALYYPIAGRDYSCSMGANNDVRIVFVNNFEASHSGLGTLDPDSMEVFGRMYHDEADGKASAIIEEMVEAAGFIPAPDFAPAQQPAAPGAVSGFSYPDPYLSFTLPFTGSSSMPTFREVLEQLLKTSMGFIYFDNSTLVRYKSFLDSTWTDIDGVPTDAYIDNQSGVDPTTEGLDETKSSDFSVQFDLYDLYTGVDFNFSHNPTIYQVTEQSFGSYDFDLDMVKRFYNTNKRYSVDCLADVHASYFNNYISKYVKLVCGRRASFFMKAFTTYGIYLGDDLLISRAKIVGEDNEAFMRVVSIGKGINEQRLTLLDLKRFPGL